MALCLATALALGVGSYLALCSRSAQFGTRIANMEKVQQLAATGLEEGMWALNQNNWTSSGPAGNAAWTTSGADRTITLDYSLPGTALSGQVVVTVANWNASTGPTPTWPTITANATIAGIGGPGYSKALQATTTPVPLFGNAIASSESYVSFAAGGTIDSWNSDPDNNSANPIVPYSSTVATYYAVIAGKSDDSGAYGVLLNQATLRGYATTFGLPVSYSTSGSPPGKILGPGTAAGTNVDTARIGKSAFVPLEEVFAVTIPLTNGSNASIIDNIVTLASRLLALPLGVDTIKFNGDLTIDGTPVVAPNLTINGRTKLIVDGDLLIKNGAALTRGKITIQPGGSLELYVTGDVTIAGDAFDNQTNDPKKLAIFCTNSSTSNALEYNSTEPFCGVIFSEKKPIDILQNAEFYGALLSRQHVRFRNNATTPALKFHYDLALRQASFSGIPKPYMVKRVTEL